MFKPIGSLRLRLSLLGLAIFGTIQAILCAGILIARHTEVHRNFDQRLLERAHLVAATLSAQPEQPDPEVLLNSAEFLGYVVQIRTPDGNTIYRSPELNQADLPWLGKTNSSVEATWIQTLSAPAAAKLMDVEGRWRVAGLIHDPAPDRSLQVQVARSLEELDQSISMHRTIVIIALFSAMMLSAVVSWVMAGRCLAPLRAMANQTRALAARNLSDRLQVPPGRNEITEMGQVINGMLDRLQRAFLGQERFVADVSHELKTPITEIMTEASLLSQRAEIGHAHREFVEETRERLRQLADMIDSLLAVAQIEGGMSPPTFVPMSVNDLVSETVERCAPSAARTRVALSTQLVMPDGDGKVPMVAVDAGLMEIAIANLIRNALRYSPPGKKVEILVTPEDNEVAIGVRDQGPGIDREFLDKIFDRFFQPPDDSPRGSAGLGLAIARMLVKLHGGTISASNLPGNGCEFIIRLPLAKRRRSSRGTETAVAERVDQPG